MSILVPSQDHFRSVLRNTSTSTTAQICTKQCGGCQCQCRCSCRMVEPITAAKCACVACNSCTCACSCRYVSLAGLDWD
jgi:hypothetical protein